MNIISLIICQTLHKLKFNNHLIKFLSPFCPFSTSAVTYIQTVSLNHILYKFIKVRKVSSSKSLRFVRTFEFEFKKLICSSSKKISVRPTSDLYAFIYCHNTIILTNSCTCKYLKEAESWAYIVGTSDNFTFDAFKIFIGSFIDHDFTVILERTRWILNFLYDWRKI